MEGEKRKSFLIWILKIIATVMVIYIHGANIFGYSKISMPIYLRPFSMLANTGVPLFMIISGFLFCRKGESLNWKVNLLKKIKRLAIPFLLWSGFWIIMEMVGYIIIPAKFDNILNWNVSDFFLNWIGIPFSHGPLYGPLWYVRDLFIISMFAPFIQKYLEKYPVFFLLVALALWFVPVNHMFRQTVLLFIIGDVFSIKSEMVDNLKNKDSGIGFLTLLLSVATSLIKTDFFYQLTILLNIISVFLLSKEIAHWREKNKRKCEFLASHIFLIYVLHGKPLSVMQIIYTTIFTNKALVVGGYLIIPIVCFVCCLIISVVFKKMLPKVYKICTGE